MIRRGTIFVRHCTKPDADGCVHAGVFGVVEADDGTIREDVVLGVGTVPGLPFTLVPTGYERDISKDEYDNTLVDSIDGYLRAQIWPKPSAETGMQGGGVVFRRTRAPAAEGRTAWIMVGVMAVPADAYPDATLHDVEGGLPSMGSGMAWIGVSNARPCPERTNGTTPSQILHMPMWGWDAEPWGLFSDLHLDTQAMCMEILRLRQDEEDGVGTDLGRARLAKLERSACAYIVTHRDRDYDEFRRRFTERVGLQRWDRVCTRAEIEEREAISMEIVRDMRTAA